MSSGESDVQRVLRQAAMRAQRLAELDVAKRTIETVLNIPMDPETLPWGAALSTVFHWQPLFLTHHLVQPGAFQ